VAALGGYSRLHQRCGDEGRAENARNCLSHGNNLLVGTSKAEFGGVLVKISDSGSGLPPANLARIFEAFYATKSSGLGMGLSSAARSSSRMAAGSGQHRTNPAALFFSRCCRSGKTALENLKSAGS
jgi:Histidine kinase-, DNA gyrase B-, and HSP90-like ATPase